MQHEALCGDRDALDERDELRDVPTGRALSDGEHPREAADGDEEDLRRQDERPTHVTVRVANSNMNDTSRAAQHTVAAQQLRAATRTCLDTLRTPGKAAPALARETDAAYSDSGASPSKTLVATTGAADDDAGTGMSEGTASPSSSSSSSGGEVQVREAAAAATSAAPASTPPSEQRPIDAAACPDRAARRYQATACAASADTPVPRS